MLKDDYNNFFSHESGIKPKQPKEEDYIVRFLTLEKMKLLLKNSALFFNRLDKFEDQSEGIWTKNDAKNWEKYKFNMPQFSKNFRNRAAVSCWCKINRKINIKRMWKDYVPSGVGMAIIVNVSNICSQVKKGLATIGADHANLVVAEVQYIDRNNHSNIDLLEPNDPLCNATLSYYQKDNQFSFENGVRLVIFAGINFEIYEAGIYIPITPLELISEIWLPTNILESKKNEIADLLRSYNLGVKIKSNGMI